MKNTNMLKNNEGMPDLENPEWTKDDFSKAMRFEDLPPEMQQALAGPAKDSVVSQKTTISIRLSNDVVEALRAMGEGWQAQADDALRAWVKQRPKRAR